MESAPDLPVTIRARVAFGLSVAEHVLDTIKSDAVGYGLAQKALDLAWKWVTEGDVTGDDLFERLENDEENGLMVHEWEAGQDEVRSSAWITLTMALAFAAWHAYKVVDETDMPESIWEISESSLGDVLDYAQKTNDYDEEYVTRLRRHLAELHGAADVSQLGQPVDREVLRRL